MHFFTNGNFFFFLLKEWQIVARTILQMKGGDAIVEREGYHKNCKRMRKDAVE